MSAPKDLKGLKLDRDGLIKILRRSQKAELRNTLQNFTKMHYIKYVKIHEYN